MKSLFAFIAVVVFTMAFSLSARAAGASDARESRRAELAERNLLEALTCDNCGVITSAAYQLGDLKSTRAVVPLMALLHDSADENTRLVAALSLCKIGDARGVFAVKREATFDDNPRMRAIFAWFYNQHVQEGTFVFASEND